MVERSCVTPAWQPFLTSRHHRNAIERVRQTWPTSQPLTLADGGHRRVVRIGQEAINHRRDSGGSALHNQILCVLCSQCVHVWLYNSPRCYSIYMKHKKTMHTIIGQLAGFWNWAIMSLIVFIWYTCWYNLHNHLGFIVPLLFLLGTGFARKKWLCPACSTVWINANKWNINKLIRFPLWSWEWSFCCFSR